MDVRNDTTLCDGRLDECVELLVTADGELEVARRDTLELEILGGVSGELEHLGTEVLENGRAVDCRGGTDTALARDTSLEEPMDPSDWELQSGLGGPACRLLLISLLLGERAFACKALGALGALSTDCFARHRSLARSLYAFFIR